MAFWLLTSSFYVEHDLNNLNNKTMCTFTDKIPNELVMVGLLALIFGRTFLQFIGSGLVTFVQTGANFVFRRHPAKKGTRLFGLSFNLSQKKFKFEFFVKSHIFEIL